MHVREIASTHPQAGGHADPALIACIEACYDCAQACTGCADACLGEPMVRDMTQCIRTCLDCADLCAATGPIASRRTGTNEVLLARAIETCAMACRLCGEECERHAARMEHCRVCANACHLCERSCRDAVATIGQRAR
jgi:hypothetical protein